MQSQQLTPTHRRFPSALRGHRLANGIKQQALAQATGFTCTALCALEKGRRPPPEPARVLALAQALGLTSQQSSQLERWAEHDRLLTQLGRSSLAEAAEMVSLALRVSWVLDKSLHKALVAQIEGHLRAAERLQQLQGAAEAHEEATTKKNAPPQFPKESPLQGAHRPRSPQHQSV